MSWFTQILDNFISFPYLEEFLSFVLLLWWLLFMLLIWSFFPFICIYFVCSTVSFLLYIYKKMNSHQEADDERIWEKPRQLAAQIVDTFGRIWHGYEVIGMENLPKGPGIIIYYHAVGTIDFVSLVAKLYKESGRKCYSVIDHSLYEMLGVKMFCDVFGLKDYKKAECVEIMKKGDFLGIGPGGAREGNFSRDYSLVWGHRTGFAQVALEAKVPIIPMFTQNICEAYRNIGNTRLTRWLYEKTRFLYLPLYGGFPVKLRTYIGEPIPYDPNITAAELTEKTKIAFENLRDKYQKRPGSILRALSERFDKHYKTN